MKKLFFITLFLFATLSAESFRPDIAESEILTGDPLYITVPVAPAEVMQAGFKSKAENIAIVEIVPSEDKKSVRIELVALADGEIEVPEIEIKTGDTINSVQSFRIVSKKRTEDSDTELRGPKATVEIMEKDYMPLWILLALLVAGLLVFLVLKLRKHFKKRVEEKIPEIVPADVARKFIEDARAKKAEGDYESFTDLVTLGMKTYMSLKSKNNYTEMTTFEVKRALKKDPLFSGDSEDILSLLRLADRYKFADAALTLADFDSMIDRFSDFLNKKEAVR